MIHPIPDGDVLLHCGDMTNVGKGKEITSVNNWIGKQMHQYKVGIAGNHDVGLDIDCYDELWNKFHSKKEDPVENRKLLTNIKMLYSESIEVMGVKIWGSPFSPEFCGWAFSSHNAE